MGFLDHMSSVFLLVGLVLMLQVHHSVGADEIIDLQFDRKSEWGLEPSDYVSSPGKLERVLWPQAIRFRENATAPVSSFNTRFRMYLHLGGPSSSQIGYTTRNETNDLEGFTFFMIPMKLDASAGGFGGYLGLLNTTSEGDPDAHTFAIEYDFVKNIEFFDPDEGFHFGVNINSMKSTVWDTLEPEAYRKNDAYVLNGGIQYDSTTQTLNVTIGNNTRCDRSPDLDWRFDGTIEMKYNFLSYKVDLSAVLNEHMYVGFTSSKSGYSTSMFLDAWSLSNSSSGSTNEFDAFSVSLPCSRAFSTTVLGTLLDIIAIMMLMVGAFAVTCGSLHGCYALRQWVERRKWRFHLDPDGLVAAEVHKFTYKELAQATKKFDSKQALGRGGFGSVYLAFLPGNREFVAVKRVAAESNQGEREFMAEVKTIGKIRHRNLVRLQGWCHERGELLLVYDLMPNGSLDKLLFGPHNAPAPSCEHQQVDIDSLESVEVKFPWERRFKAIVDVAKALVYLHTECEERIIHRDVKAANVMLDAKFNARLGDFGLARSYNHSLLAPESTGVAGTPGYLAPELYYTGVQTEQTDIFSYGAFLLEVACGKRPIHRENHETVLVLVDEVWKMWGDSNILDAADPNLGGVYSAIELNMVLCLGLLCSHPSPTMRPSMKEVLLILNGDASLPQVPRSKPSGGYEIERSFSLGSSYTTDPSLHHNNHQLDHHRQM